MSGFGVTRELQACGAAYENYTGAATANAQMWEDTQ